LESHREVKLFPYVYPSIANFSPSFTGTKNGEKEDQMLAPFQVMESRRPFVTLAVIQMARIILCVQAD